MFLSLCANRFLWPPPFAFPQTKMEDLKLYYWNGRGLMEVGRMVLAAAGKKAGVDYA